MSYPITDFREGTRHVQFNPFFPRLEIYVTIGSLCSLILRAGDFTGTVPCGRGVIGDEEGKLIQNAVLASPLS